MDPYERLVAINESMKKAQAMLRKNPAAMADAQQFAGTGHMRPDSKRRIACMVELIGGEREIPSRRWVGEQEVP